ncbi:glycosyltransferase family 4 protein [Lentzea sp. NBC_00516]|uniref:glycosyltransferase family 4 protein n=1 Tax=Lentzea sp. NBC_00516 TaxID=2903582 RepID=UPI002E80B8D4|nr:glycosyltransferase family 4 protein [Lentzea sp. NBC_00516]WUD27189.1 glycosyltransferase family 4 protein [Lentzea sp. NBC_00516]
MSDALKRTDWADVDVLPPARAGDISLGLAVARDDEAFEDAVARSVGELVVRRPDVVLVNTVEGLATAEASRRLGVPFCWAIHESYTPAVLWASVFEFGAPSALAIDAFERCLAAADAVLSVSQETQDLFALHVHSSRSRVIPFRASMRAEWRKPSHRDRRWWQIPEDAFLVVSVSTLEERKNPGLLVAAAARARRLVPNLHLLLAGPGTSTYGAWLASLAEDEKFSDAFTHVRSEVDVSELLPLADLYISASDIESRPVVLLEAMEAGVPIVATRACGVAELVDDGINGLLCPLGDRGALADAIVTLAGAPHRRAELARRASMMVDSLPANWADAVVVAMASVVLA